MADICQVLNAKASIYTLIDGKTWAESGSTGQMVLYYVKHTPHELLVRWWKHDQSLSYKLLLGEIRNKGPHSWMLRCLNMLYTPPTKQVIAIRFTDPKDSIVFKQHFETVSEQAIPKKPLPHKKPPLKHVVTSPIAAPSHPPTGMDFGLPHSHSAPHGGGGYAPQTLPPKPGRHAAHSGHSGHSGHAGHGGYGGHGGHDAYGAPRGGGGHQAHHAHHGGGGHASHAGMGAGRGGGGYGGHQAAPHGGYGGHQPAGHGYPAHGGGGGGGGGHYSPPKHAHQSHSAHKIPQAGWSCDACQQWNTGVACSRCQRPKSLPKKRPSTHIKSHTVAQLASRSPVVESHEEMPLPGGDGDDFSLIKQMMKMESQQKQASSASADAFAAERKRQEEERIRLEQEREKLEEERRQLQEERRKREMEKMRLEAERREAEDEERRWREEQERRRREWEEQTRADEERRRKAAKSGGGAPSEEVGAPSKRSWRCPICTLMNPAGSARCEACDTPKSSGGFGMGMIDHDDHSSAAGDVEYQSAVMREPVKIKMERSRSGSTKSLYDLDDGGSPTGSPRSGAGEPQFGGGALGPGHGSKFVQDYETMRKMGGVTPSQAGGAATAHDFEKVVTDITCYNEYPAPVLGTLRSVAKKLLKGEERYRSLDTTNPKVEERLIGYEGVLDFLYLLGFQSDKMGQRLVCNAPPSEDMIKEAIRILELHEKKVDQPQIGFGVVVAGGDEKDDDLAEALRQIQEMEAQAAVAAPGGDGGGAEEEEDGDDMTVRQVILWCTHEKMRDNDTMEILFMCHREFSSSTVLLKQLKQRFFVQQPPDLTEAKEIQKFQTETMKPIQLNVIKNLRSWMKQFWDEDFAEDEDLQDELDEFVKAMQSGAKKYPWHGLLANAVRTEAKRYRKTGSKQSPVEDKYEDVTVPEKFKFESLKPELLADQVTLMDFSVFSRIGARECLGQAWKKKDNKKKSPNILKMIAQFNNLTNFVQLQILRAKTLKKRGNMLNFIIRMGDCFKNLRNYNSLCAVFSALNSAPIHRLKLAWERVDKKQKAQFEEFKVIFSRDYNHRNLRQLFRNAAAPSIPHIGIFLQDLVFIDDGNDDEKKIDNMGGKTMVNFTKCQRMGERIKNIQMYQQQPFTKCKEDRLIQRILREEFGKLKDITEDTIWDISTEVKKNDERDGNRFF